jgi:hypothetical protein
VHNIDRPAVRIMLVEVQQLRRMHQQRLHAMRVWQLAG